MLPQRMNPQAKTSTLHIKYSNEQFCHGRKINLNRRTFDDTMLMRDVYVEMEFADLLSAFIKLCSSEATEEASGLFQAQS